MFEKKLTVCALLDYYAPLLSERHREVLDYSYNQDLSLAEIAAEIGISRQGVRDAIKKAEEEIFHLEEKLRLCERAEAAREAAERLLALDADDEVRHAVQVLCEAAGIQI